MKKRSAWAIACLAIATGCVGEVSGSGEDALEPDEAQQVVGSSSAIVDLELGFQLEAPDEALRVHNRLVRDAIFQGNALASEALERIVTSTLGGFGLDATYIEAPLTADSAPEGMLVGSDVVTTGETDEDAPLGTVGNACAYARQANEATQMSCRFVLNRATVRAYDEIVDDVNEKPLAEDALDGALDRSEVLDWYREAANFGVENTTQVLGAMRAGQVCDQAPSVVETAFEVGARLGRETMKARVRAVASVTPHTVCNVDRGIVDPAFHQALRAVPVVVDRNPLCTAGDGADFTPRTALAGAIYANNVEQMRQGIFAGIEEQRPVESARLVRTWVCIPPPPPPPPPPVATWAPPPSPVPSFTSWVPVPAPIVPHGFLAPPAAGLQLIGWGWGDPLVLDLDGDGIEVKSLADGPVIDFAQYGRAQTEWVGANDALLAIDRDGDGSITSDELFGDITRTEDGLVAADGFEALAAYDSPSRGGNGDGVIDESDDIFTALCVWRDRNGDGETNAGENAPLRDHHIAAIDLDWRAIRFEDGREHEVRDVWFRYEAL